LGKIFIGETAKQDADAWFANIDNEMHGPNMSELIIPPGIPTAVTAEKNLFGGGGYFTVMSDRVLTQPDVDYILSSNLKVFIVARFRYFDAAGQSYWSDVCLSRFNSGAYPECTQHNEMH
jgi:hypothetical protein